MVVANRSGVEARRVSSVEKERKKKLESTHLQREQYTSYRTPERDGYTSSGGGGDDLAHFGCWEGEVSLLESGERERERRK